MIVRSMIDATRYKLGFNFNNMIEIISREIENESFDYFLVPLRGGYVFFDFLIKIFRGEMFVRLGRITISYTPLEIAGGALR